MGRTKRPPVVHIPFTTTVTGITNPRPQTEKPQLPTLSGNLPNEKSPAPILPPPKPVEQETPAPVGGTECPHCNVDFSNMAIVEVRHHVLSCSRPTTAGSASQDSDLSDPPDSPKPSADQRNIKQDEESEFEEFGEFEDFEEFELDDLPKDYDDDDEEGSQSPAEEPLPAVKFPKLKDPKEILASLEAKENMSVNELYRRAANVANILDTYQREWMAQENATAKASAGDGVPNPRNPRAVKDKTVFQDKVQADVYGFEHNPHPTLTGRQDPIRQRQSATGDGDTKSRLRKQTSKMNASGSFQDGLDEGRPVRKINTPSRYESESREQTPVAGKKPRGRGKGSRLVELRAEQGSGRVPSPLAHGSMSDPDHHLSMKDRALASTEADEEDSGINSRASSSSSSQSHEVDGTSTSGRKRRRADDAEEDKTTKKKPRTKANSTKGAKTGEKKTRAKQMTIVDGVPRSKQSLMMQQRWAVFKANPNGPRIGRVRNSQSGEKDAASDSHSSRKRSLDETNDQTGAAGGGRKRHKVAEGHHAVEENGAERSEQSSQVPVKGKRGGRREGSGRKPAKGSESKTKKLSRASAEQYEASDGHLDDDDHATRTPVQTGGGELFEPSSTSTRASARTRKPSAAKQEADNLMPSAKKSQGAWGGKREKGKRGDGSGMGTSNSRLAKNLREEDLGADEYGTEGDSAESQDEEQEGAEYEDDETPSSQKKPAKGRKDSSKGSSAAGDYPDLPVYDPQNPSAEYKALPKNLKMKAVSRARWKSGGMGHMFGQKGASKQKLDSGDNNSTCTSVSEGTMSAPPSTRHTKPKFRNTGHHDASDERDMESPAMAGATTPKPTEYEQFKALATPNLDIEGGGGKRGRRPAALRASNSFLELAGTSSDFEDEDGDQGEVIGDDRASTSKQNKNRGDKEKKEKEKKSRKGVGGRPPRAMMPLPIQTDVANAGVLAPPTMSRSGSNSGGKVWTAYEEFQALSAPGSPMVLGKRNRNKVSKRGGGGGGGGFETPTTDDNEFDD